MADNTILYGKWYFNDSIDYMGVPNTYVNFAFVDSNDNIVRCRRMYDYTGNGMFTYETEEGGWYFPSSATWEADSMYRTIWITGGGTDTFLTWLQANATKVSESLDPEESMTNAQLYNRKMGELVDIINEKADSSGNKSLDELISTANNIIKPSGNIVLNKNEQYDITNYATATVSVPVGVFPSGTLEISINGKYNVESFKEANVIVQNEGGATIEDLLNKTIAGEYVNNTTRMVGNVFSNCYNLTSITFTNCNYIDVNAFNNCSNLTKVDLPQCTYVSASAFYNCSGLKEVNLPQCTSVKDNAFAGYLSFNLNFPEGVIFSSYAFSSNGVYSLNAPKCIYWNWCLGQTGTFYTHINLPNCIMFKDIAKMYSKSDATLEISLPKCLDFMLHTNYTSAIKKVYLPFCRTIGSQTFSRCYQIQEFYAPNVTVIEADAFVNSSIPIDYSLCTNVYSGAFGTHIGSYINLPNVLTIGSRAFYNCFNVEYANLSACIAIGSSAFASCSKLKSIELACASLNYNTFDNCNSLESVYILNSNTTLSNSNVFSRTPLINSTYLGYYGSIFVPASLVESYKTKTNWAIYADRITALPSEYDSNYVYVKEFLSTNISEIPLSKLNVRKIFSSGFASCSNLTTVNLPQCECIIHGAFANCSNLTTVSLPQCTHLLGSSAFYNCSNLKSIELGNCLYIGFSAFANCTSLIEANLPQCTYVDAYAFTSCFNLTSVNLPQVSIINQRVFQSCSKLENVVFSKINYIREGAFFNCYNLKSIDLSTCFYIDTYAFYNCSSLTEIGNLNECVCIKSYAFLNCPFSKVSANKLIYLENGFQNCSNLTELYFPQLKILSSGIIGCSNLKKIILPNVAFFSSVSFYNCNKLEGLYLTNSNFYVYASNSTVNEIFQNTPMLNTGSNFLGSSYGSIYVHERQYSNYINDKNWSRWADRFVSMTQTEVDELLASLQ